MSYLLQIKDRHNGNIMIDKHGYIIHIGKSRYAIGGHFEAQPSDERPGGVKGVKSVKTQATSHITMSLVNLSVLIFDFGHSLNTMLLCSTVAL